MSPARAEQLARRTATALALLVSAVVALTVVSAAARAQPTECQGRPLTQRGTRGDDLLIGSDSVRDSIAGWDGNDDIYGLGLGDWLCGNDGNDDINGDDGPDVANGGAGVDYIWGSTGNDGTLFGGASGDALISGDGGADVIEGNLGNDYVFGDGGDDTLRGSENDDTIYGRCRLQRAASWPSRRGWRHAFSATSTKAVPRLGCPAKGSSVPGVKIRIA